MRKVCLTILVVMLLPALLGCGLSDMFLGLFPEMPEFADWPGELTGTAEWVEVTFEQAGLSSDVEDVRGLCEAMASQETELFYWTAMVDLGDGQAGEVFRVDILTAEDRVDAFLLDEDGTLLGAGTQQAGEDVFIDLAVRSNSDNPYMIVQSFEPFEFTLFRFVSKELSGPCGQIVVLDFGGSEAVEFAYRGVDEEYETGPAFFVEPLEDEIIRAACIESFMESFDGYGLTVLTDDDPLPDGSFSTIYIGVSDFSPGLAGLSEHVDLGNRYEDDVAVVNAGCLAADVMKLFSRRTAGEFLGKVAAHEMGHLLGLLHVWDPEAIMSDSRLTGIGLDISYVLEKQYTVAPICGTDDGIDVLFGYQDAPRYLSEILGPAEE